MVMNNNISSDFRENMQKCQEYIGALEEERRKIQVFERELPLCVELVSQAIQRCRQQMSGTIMNCFNGQSDQHSEQTSGEGPVLEESIPMKRTSTIEDDQEKQQQHHPLSHKPQIICRKDKSSSVSMKSEWLRSAHLSIQTPDPPSKEDLRTTKLSALEVNRNIGCGAFHPLKKKKCSGIATVLTAATSSSADTDEGANRSEDKKQSNKKERRSWSPELHKRFLYALQQLGGAHVATPKQIGEFMKVDGLTNDEIKSHLQKYRLHIRRLGPTIHSNPQTSQFVVVGGIWMPPPEYTTMVASSPMSGDTNNIKGVYAPIASLPPSIIASLCKTKQCKQQSHSDEKGSSFSAHTTTASPSF